MSSQENKDSMTIKTSSSSSVFEPGRFLVKTINLKKSDASSSPPVETLIVMPETEGDYPVLLFFHGYGTNNTWYSQILKHISSHGYIVVAPQFYQYLLISMNDETKTALKVTNWLSTSLSTSLPKHIRPNLTKLALSGHGRGGKTAFSLALRHTSLKFKALFGIDPTSGPTPPVWLEQKVLSYVPHSFDISIPIGITGTGLSNQFKAGLIPPLAPDGFNHSEFFNESKPPCCYFLAKDYGICDVLDDPKAALAGLVCKSGKGDKEKMRRSVGGVVVSFLKAYLGGEFEDLQSLVDEPSLAPVTLDPVIRITYASKQVSQNCIFESSSVPW